MRWTSIAVTTACLSITAADAASECTQYGEISGTVRTVNLSPVLQYGVTGLAITKNGKPYFSGVGVIVGEVVTPTNEDGQSTLNHTIYFADGTKLQTHLDTAQVLGPVPGKVNPDGTPCAFNVHESITDVTADKKLKRLSIAPPEEISADGTISFCSGENENHFTLSGTVCFQ